MRKHYGNVVTDCTGDVTMATKVDDEMRRYVEQEADRLEVSKAEFVRLLLVAYRDGHRSAEAVPVAGTARCEGV